MIDTKTGLYCLIGNPVSKSLSPLIHNLSFKDNEINAKYMTFRVKDDDLENAVKGLKALNIKGFNITIPYKEKIIEYLDDLSEDARLLKAVNTVKNENGRLVGYNTDGLGFLETLNENLIQIKQKNVLIIGAGGAARAISFSLAKIGVRKIIIINRTLKRANKLMKDISDKYPNVIIETYQLDEYMPKDNLELIINTTSVGMYPNIEYTPISLDRISAKYIYDIIYKPKQTKFLTKAKENGYNILGGIDMLINQALISEEIWLNYKFDKQSEKFRIKKRIYSENIELL